MCVCVCVAYTCMRASIPRIGRSTVKRHHRSAESRGNERGRRAVNDRLACGHVIGELLLQDLHSCVRRIILRRRIMLRRRLVGRHVCREFYAAALFLSACASCPCSTAEHCRCASSSAAPVISLLPALWIISIPADRDVSSSGL